MNKQKSLEEIQYLINEGNDVLKTKYNYCGEITGSEMFVDDEIFSTWKEKVNLFLKSDLNFQSSLESFNKKFSMRTNLRYAEQYLSVLKALKDSIERDIITFNNIDKKENHNTGSIFIGHGHSKLWKDVVLYLRDDLKLDNINYFEKKSQAGRFIGDALRDFNQETSFAIIVMTAEDETKDKKFRARQNVIHETGFFQGKLGFEKVAILKQKEVESFSNIDGLQYIEFSENNIKQTFYDLRKMLEREHIL